MDDKKINLLPDNLRFKEDKSKRSALSFNPDFKKPGKKEKAHSYKPSGSQVSLWSKIFKREQKPKVAAPVAPKTLGSTISYNDENKLATETKAVPIEMHVPPTMSVKVEEHIQDFVPAQAKVAAAKGPSFWSKFARKPKAKVQKTASSALSNGLKYNGNGNGNNAMHQPEGKPDITILQELNKQAEETNNFSPKKISDQVSAVVKENPKAIVEQKPRPIPSYALEESKVAKVKGPSWWSKFLALFQSKPRVQKIKSSALNNGLQYNGNSEASEPKKQPDLKTFRELNKQVEDIYSFNLPKEKTNNQTNEVTKPETNFDLTKTISEEINLAPLKPITPEPEPIKLEEEKISNDFSMPEYAPKVENQEMSVAKDINVDNPKPRVTGPQFHMPEANERTSLLNGRVDLIPIAARVRSWRQILALFGFAIMLSVLILAVIYGYVIYEEQRIIAEQNARKADIAKIEAKILDFTELNKNISTLGQEIKLVQEALNKHIYWTNFFSLLEKYTVNDVYYSGLAVGTNGGLTLTASTKSYDSVAKQLKVLNSDPAKEFVKAASITGANKSKDENVSFQISIILNQDLFYWSGQ